MRTLLLPSLTTPGHFLVTHDIDLDDALGYIESFQARVLRNAVAERQAPEWCHMDAASTAERQYGDHVQALMDFPVDEFEPIELVDAGENDLTDLGRVNLPGLSGLRAVYVQASEESTRASIVLGTLVVFNSRRSTSGYRDIELAEHIGAIKANEAAERAVNAAGSGLAPEHIQTLNAISQALLAQAQALQAPILAHMAAQITEITSGERPQVAPASKAEPSVSTGVPELDQVVQQVLDQGRDVVDQAAKGFQRARSWLADQIDRKN